jgi:hypothetical protein
MISRRITIAAVVALAALTAAACGDDDTAGSATTTPVRPTTPIAPTTNAGGGGMSAGAPSFESFVVASSVPCRAGNAEARMSYTTLNVVDIGIKIGNGGFEETAGYGPTDTDAVATIPCSGAGTTTVQLRGCTEDGECADSPARNVTITG